MVTNMAAACQFALVDIYNQISSKFIIWASFIKLLSRYEYWLCPMNRNQDDHQTNTKMAAACGHYNLVTYHPISSQFNACITFCSISSMFEYRFRPINDNQDGRHQWLSPYHCRALCGTLCLNLVGLISFIIAKTPPCNHDSTALFRFLQNANCLCSSRGPSRH